jgi:hypothetical protein
VFDLPFTMGSGGGVDGVGNRHLPLLHVFLEQTQIEEKKELSHI